MKSLHRIAIAAPLIVLHAWAGEIPSKQIAARTELHQIQTLTLSDQQFLNGDTGGKPVTITGQLRIAQGSGLAPARRSETHRADGLLTRRTGHSLCESQAIQPIVEQIRCGICGLCAVLSGLHDDYNPISVCKAYVERLRAAGRDVEVTEYPNAAHAFDNPLGAQPAAVS